MRKFLLPIINLVNLVLVVIVWVLTAQTAVNDIGQLGQKDVACGNYYQVVWEGSRANVLGIVSFFLFCVAVLLTLVVFLPIKVRKFLNCFNGLAYIGAGVLFLLAPIPPHYARGIAEAELTGSLIAMAVLVFIAGAFSLLMSVIEFLGKKEAK